MLFHYAKYREFLVEHGARSVISNIAKGGASGGSDMYPASDSAASFLKGLGIRSGRDQRRPEKSRQKFDDWYVSDSDEEETRKMNAMPFWREKRVRGCP